jgi:hypothetical protein
MTVTPARRCVKQGFALARRVEEFGHFRIAGGIDLPFFVGNFVGNFVGIEAVSEVGGPWDCMLNIEEGDGGIRS